MKLKLVLVALLATGSLAHSAFAQDAEKNAAKAAELLQEGRILLGQEDYGKAAEVLAELVKVDPENALGWQLHGYALHASGKLDAAIKSHKKASKFDSTKGIALYNLACAYSLKKENDKALAYLEKAVDAKFLQTQYYETDTDLDNIRDDKKFKYLLAVVKNGGKKPETTTKQDDKKKKFNAKSLIGTWKVTSGERSGEKIDATRLPPAITITDKELTIPTGDDNPFKFAYKVDAKKNPIAIDFKITGGPVPEGQAVGILKIENGKATLCYDSTGQERPKKFETEDGDGRFLFVMEKVKSEKKKSEDK